VTFTQLNAAFTRSAGRITERGRTFGAITQDPMNTPIRALAVLASAIPLLLAAQMSGTYTVVPGGGGNYTTITAAVNDLNALGVSGPVTISIASGTYAEAFTINAVNGASSVNTVTFTSAAASASSVIIAPLSASLASDFAVILLNGTDHVRLMPL
jgi:pectin methylesterase-like acyl-CoA thioesterase